MAHIKGHINVPAQKASSNEVKDSFFTSFKKTLFGDNNKDRREMQFKEDFHVNSHWLFDLGRIQ